MKKRQNSIIKDSLRRTIVSFLLGCSIRFPLLGAIRLAFQFRHEIELILLAFSTFSELFHRLGQSFLLLQPLLLHFHLHLFAVLFLLPQLLRLLRQLHGPLLAHQLLPNLLHLIVRFGHLREIIVRSSCGNAHGFQAGKNFQDGTLCLSITVKNETHED